MWNLGACLKFLAAAVLEPDLDLVMEGSKFTLKSCIWCYSHLFDIDV